MFVGSKEVHKSISIQEIEIETYIVTVNERRKENDYRLVVLHSDKIKGNYNMLVQTEYLIKEYGLQDDDMMYANELENGKDQGTVREFLAE